MIREYINNVNATQDSWFASDPYYFVRIDSIDHGTNGIQKSYISSFAAGDTTYIEGTDDSGFNWMGLDRASANTTITFTKSFTIPSTGYYLVELFIWKKPTVSGDFDLTIAGTSVWTESGYNQWSDYGTVVRVPIQYLTSGSKSFVLTVPKFAGAGWLKISHLYRYEGGKDLIDTSETRLDLIKAEFSQNGITEVDHLDLTVAMKDDYWRDDRGNNPMAFDIGDHVTFVLGQDSVEARPVFGGYVTGWSLNDEATELTIKCTDRLIDLSRTMIYKNFSIGYLPTADSGGTMPFTQFPNVNEIARYLCTALYHIDYNGIVQDYRLYNNFSRATDVSGLSVSGFDAKWETTFGHPGTCMRLIPTLAGPNYVTLFESSTEYWDASDFNMFNFDYYASGAGVKYPVRFNVEIEMWKEGETVADVATYVIRFNGPTPTTGATQIAQVTPKYDGDWQTFNIDLKAAFDKVAGSEEYWIHSVKLVGLQDVDGALNRRCSSLYIDHVMGYRNITQAPRYASQDTKTALEELQDLCAKTNQVAYIRPGMERYEDQMIMLPRAYYTLPIQLDTSNIMRLSAIEYLPLDWGIINFVKDTFNYDDTKSGTTKYYDLDSEKHYGVWMDHEFLSDVNTLANATLISKAKVEKNALNYVGFTAEIYGSVLLEPGQYIPVTYPNYHINGTYEAQAIVHNIDFVNEIFMSTIEFGRTTGVFNDFIRRVRSIDTNVRSVKNTSVYGTLSSLAAGFETSLGAYSN